MADAGVPEQSKIKWGRLLVTLLVGGVLTAIFFILKRWWWGTAFLLLTLLVSCFSLPRVIYPTAFTLYAIFSIAWISEALLHVALNRGWESAWWRTALPIVAGILIGIAGPVLFWFLSLAASTKWLLGLPETKDIPWWKAFVFVGARTFGFARPYVRVENGKMVEPLSTRGLFAKGGESELAKKFGGPGELEVSEGNVVVLEVDGKLSRIVGHGTYALKPREWFKKPIDGKGILDLRPCFAKPAEISVVTKDGYPLVLKWGAGLRLELKAATDKRPASRAQGAESRSRVINPDSQFAIYEETVKKAVYNTGAGTWRDGYPNGAIAHVRPVAAKYTLEQIVGEHGTGPDQENPIRGQIASEVKTRIGDAPSGQGVTLNWIDILEVTMPPNVEEVMTKRWQAPIKNDLLRREAEANRDALIEEDKAKLEKIRAVERIRANLSAQWMDVFGQLETMLKTFESPEVAQQFISVIGDLLSRIGREEIDWRLLGWPDVWDEGLDGPTDRRRGPGGRRRPWPRTPRGSSPTIENAPDNPED
jgi:regulator of protease activity HflC (stomatin/prohibitin superfamily)